MEDRTVPMYDASTYNRVYNKLDSKVMFNGLRCHK